MGINLLCIGTLTLFGNDVETIGEDNEERRWTEVNARNTSVAIKIVSAVGLIIAVILLNQTTGTKAVVKFYELTETWKTPEDFARGLFESRITNLF